MWIILTVWMSYHERAETLLYVRDMDCLMSYLEVNGLDAVTFHRLKD